MVADKQIPKGFQQTEIGIIPNDWTADPMDEVCVSIASGKSKTKTQIGGSFPIYGSTGLIGLNSMYDYEGDRILVARVGANAGTVNNVSGKYCVSDNTLMIQLKKGINFSFIFYLLNYFNLNRLIFGSGQPLITGTQIKNLIIPLPPTKAEQTAIAAVLNDADKLITELEKLIAKKKLIKQGAMQELLRPKEGWANINIGEECELITKGTTPTSIGRDFQNDGINFIKIESLTINGRIIKDKVAYIDSNTNNLLKRSQLKSNDILFSIAGALGRIALVSDEILPANTNQALSIIRLKKGTSLDLKYLFYYLNSTRIQTLLLAINVQGAQANLSLQNISELPIDFPVMAEQSQISTILSDMDSEIESLEKKLAKYKMIKQGMMQNLLTGKIRLV